MHRFCWLMLVVAFAAAGDCLAWNDRNLMSDTWTATDALGRTLPGFEECGPPREGKTVGIFYFIWLGQHTTSGPYDISKITADNPTDPQWGPVNHFHHWGEPELGYYVSTEDYVIRSHARMLANAGIDVIVFDVTNSFTYPNVYIRLCEIYTQMRMNGGRTPQIGFIAHSHEEKTVEKLYDDFYSKGLYRDLWFMWKGKPLIMANPDNMRQDIKDFFTFRHSWAWSDPNGWFGDGKDKWPWVDHYPQSIGWHEKGFAEYVSVSAAQHPMTNIGRSFHDGKEPEPADRKPEQGLFFAEQWKRALEVDPEFIFITGWNEWVAQRFLADGVYNLMTGRKPEKGETFFVDQYDQEYSRDIEPMKGGHTDNYYYQMIAGIRRFKGIRAREKSSGPRTIRIDGRFADWTLVKPEYLDWVGDTEHRDSQGWNDALHYVNTTGRNDFVRLKVAYDKENVYFYAETKDPITPPTDPKWMLLYLDTDSDPKNGWHGYDFIVDRNLLHFAMASRAPLSQGNGTHGTDVTYSTHGNKLEVSVSRAILGLLGKPVKLDFHWADNIQKLDDIIEFSISGDSAPDRRFNYHFEGR